MLDADDMVVPQVTEFGYNLVGLLPGSDPTLADEYMVVMAHFDHLGVTDDGEVFNGAFDNAAAVGMNLELARVLIEQDAAPGRSIVFLFTDDEENGLVGAEEWIAAPTVPASQVVFGISTDPLGRRMLPDFGPIVLAGLERSPALLERWREAARFVEAPVYFIHRDVIPVFASDQDEFFRAATPKPAGWFTNLGFAHYHTVDDDAETIDYRMILDDVALLGNALALIGSDDQTYAYEGTFEPAGKEATEAKRLFEDMLKSSFPYAGDIDDAQGFIDQLDVIIEADDRDAVDNPELLFTAALYYLLFDMSAKYPGEIPPPWPEGW